MEYRVLIQPKRGSFTATIPTLPECRAQGKTEKEALDKVRARAQEVLTKSKFVTINLPENGHNEDDPWLAMAGIWRDDPTSDEYQRLIKKYRKRPPHDRQKNDPWLTIAGKWANDPTFDDFQKIIEKFRKRPKAQKT